MAKLLIGSIDLSKIDKKRIITKDKNGNDFENGAKYYNVVVWINDEIDQYGNIASIQEGISKEERESGLKATYIGNLKNVQGQTVASDEKEPEKNNDDQDDLPF
jgi:hypothetical protein